MTSGFLVCQLECGAIPQDMEGDLFAVNNLDFTSHP